MPLGAARAVITRRRDLWLPETDFPNIAIVASMKRSPDLPGENQDITSWKDLVNEWHFDQFETRNVPQQVVRDNRLAARFVEDPDLDTLRSVGSTRTTAFGTAGLMYVVAEPDAVDATGTPGHRVFSDLTFILGISIRLDGGNPHWQFAVWTGSTYNMVQAPATGGRDVVIAWRDTANDLIWIEVNGGTPVSAANTALSSTGASDPMHVTESREPEGRRLFDGWMHECGCATGHGTAQDRAALVDFLAAEWNVT